MQFDRDDDAMTAVEKINGELIKHGLKIEEQAYHDDYTLCTLEKVSRDFDLKNFLKYFKHMIGDKELTLDYFKMIEIFTSSESTEDEKSLAFNTLFELFSTIAG